MNLTLDEIAQAVQGQATAENVSVEGVGIDTRTLKSGELYVAIKGRQFDGHAFCDQAHDAGARALLVSEAVASPLPQIRVADTRLALAKLAGYWRNKMPVKIAGVTGSNGKTSVKEMLAAIFATQGNTLYTQGNLNNDIGVPLTLLRLNDSHRYAVIEMGANHPGEIAFSSRYARADVSVITNVGRAHIEGFGDTLGVANTKAEIIENLGSRGVAVLPRDDAFYDFWLSQKVGGRRSVSFGFSAAADLRAENIQSSLTAQGFSTQFDLVTQAKTETMRLNLAGAHNVKNALAAAAVAMQFGIGLSDIRRGLEQMRPVTGRMQALLGRKGNIVIDDTYNANPDSLKAALDASSHEHKPLWLALGAFGELGPQSSAIHAELGELIRTGRVERLFATGELAKHTVKAFGEGGRFFDSRTALIDCLSQEATGKEIIIIKGSRAQKMEQVVAALVDNFRAA
ncbi:UDP-N-acetylmuramoyl-tripeptide--D-alanyl-D-alanine ligase [Methylomonas sp. SURF-2]|uniref:UDP-N-acetylmuramoyl-tripeptide--D-alanyl-D-alanine ligase n=1 Tax=Methylomonas subterranea TaxID=2952225 RepID=A0ABT1TFY5_9GAMM|nr:UDP-N-acetylmuramoyl-tripeptide--D-alanyl-D-alanine ligase [Methylomonas sp. SURF-2]MCQ8104161.1 UDP-N-acetylmuramoyl-tripeptide--D-alanyl-D-alanine ligase [Methylomonas sp. SURF-2]